MTTKATTPLPASAYPDPDGVALLGQLLDEVSTLGSALRPLHEAGLLWLNFDPQGLECAGGRLQLTNLDLVLFAAGEGPEFLQLSPAYCAPETYYGCPEQIGPATDVFHLGLYAYYRLAGLLPGGFPGQGLGAFDFALPPLRVYRPRLPPGVVPVLGRALALDPVDRFGSVADFVDALSGGPPCGWALSVMVAAYARPLGATTQATTVAATRGSTLVRKRESRDLSILDTHTRADMPHVRQARRSGPAPEARVDR